MQWLVYVQNLGENGEEREQGAILAGSPLAPARPGVTTFARVFVDELAPDPAGAIKKVLAELFRDYPPFEGAVSSHMTEHANLEVCTGPGFDSREVIEAALLDALEDARKVA